MKKIFAVVLVALLSCIFRDSRAEERRTFLFVDSAEGYFEYRPDNSNIYVWPATHPKKGGPCKFSGLVTDSTHITVVEGTPVLKTLIPLQLRGFNSKRVAAFGAFTQVQHGETVALLRVDYLFIVVLPDKGGVQ